MSHGPFCSICEHERRQALTEVGCQVLTERDRYKSALERILNIRLQDKQLVDAWKEARQIAFGAFDSLE